jgi:urea transport system permease protein
VPAGSVFHLSDYAVALVGQDHVLRHLRAGHGPDLGLHRHPEPGPRLFFALGGYAMGMYLMRQIGTDGNYKSNLPDFMVFLDWKTLPWHWTLSDSFHRHAVPDRGGAGLVAFVFGYFAFRSRIKGCTFPSSPRP